ncbi:hypothetical protein EAF00_001178 [Botryotinia globosa]|nr:hypothetical protein EAF00_001178 [Botryotinia globosa]
MDGVILTVLLLSHFENSMTQKAQSVTEDIKVTAAKAFNHHDGAIVILNLRLQRQQEQYRPLYSIIPTHTSNSNTSHENAGSELDKITRRHLWADYYKGAQRIGTSTRVGNEVGQWAREIPMMDNWNTFRVRDDDEDPGANDILDQTVHLYPSISHAAMWAQYRAILFT